MICFQDFVPIFLVLDLLGRLYTTHEHPFWGLIAILTNILVFRMNDIYRTWSLAWVNFLVSGCIGLHGNHDLYYDLWLLTLFCTYFLLIKAYVGSAILAISLLRLQNDRDSETKLWAYTSLLLAITFPRALAKFARITGISGFLGRLSATIRIYFLYLIYISYFFLADISNSIYVSSSNLITTIRQLFARRLLAAAVCLDPSLNEPKSKTKSTFEVSNVVTTVDVVPRLPPVQAIATQTELLDEELNTRVQAAFSPKPKPIPKILRVIQQRKAATEVKSSTLNGSQRVAPPWQQRKEREQQEQEQDEKERLEKKQQKKERLERERREKEQREEKQQEQERREKEQLQKERQEKDSREKEKREKERQWKEQLEREEQRNQQQPATTANSASPVSVSAPASTPVPQIDPVGIAAAVPAPRALVPAQPEPDLAGAEPEPEPESAPYARIFPIEPAVDEDKPGELSPQQPTIPIGERRILKPRPRKAKKAPQRQPEQQRQERPERQEKKVALLLPSLSQKEPQQQQEQEQQEEKKQDEDKVMVNVAPPAPTLQEQHQQQDDQEELPQELQEELMLALMEDEPTPSQEPQKEQHRGQEQGQEQEQEQPQQMDAEATPFPSPRPLMPLQQLLPAAMDVDQPQEGRFGDIKNINTSFLLSPLKKKVPSAMVWPPPKASQPAAAARPKPKPAKKEPPTEEEKKKVVADVMRRRKAQASSPFLPKKNQLLRRLKANND
ncbi:hypothetical protein DL762_000313 [Monosporascus cannonballus]|uniref:Uncharacterized protein n=1 Tax=Monosporascus cannonballus TaxID=155416 RepID=A0ABY0HJE2_9PEZI|nr:hypothetical protein DL763_010687 [Monosporascus cannonballus]RYO94879.1 hypothetical protein DL762_000313 [Monosporascus cannonballus]